MHSKLKFKTAPNLQHQCYKSTPFSSSNHKPLKQIFIKGKAEEQADQIQTAAHVYERLNAYITPGN